MTNVDNGIIQNNQHQIICPAGSLVFFDSMLFHRAGNNETKSPRIGLNYNFVRPFIKQQYQNISKQGQGSFNYQLFGEDYYPSSSTVEYRTKKINQIKK